MKLETFVKKAQEAMNSKGGNLKVDGVWGDKTTNEAEKYEFKVEAFLEENRPSDFLDGYASTNNIIEPTFVILPEIEFVNRGNYSTVSGKFKGLTVHYTVSGRSSKNARSVVEYLKSRGFGCMVMDEDGIIYIPKNFDIFKSWGYHSGVSKWKGIKNVSDHFAGMEICCWGRGSSVGPIREVNETEGYVIAGKYQEYTKAQEKSLINFILWAKSKNSEFDLDYVVGHDELRKEAGLKGDKQDPGGSLSMTMPDLRNLLKTKAIEFGI
jgi:N-acetyl-anhydromuramyl-L-alanine amidase AmpD